MKLSRITLVAAAALVALAGAAVAGVVAHASSSVTTIRVTEKEYSIHLSAKPTAGSVRFVVRNTGTFTHALSIKGPGVSKRTPGIGPGKSATLLVTLKSGTYAIWCPEPGHAAKGMKASFKIAAAAAGGGSSGGGVDTSTGSGDTTTDSGVPWG
jgi:uncharacterized cupredoxin-like copper-binding protein